MNPYLAKSSNLAVACSNGQERQEPCANDEKDDVDDVLDVVAPHVEGGTRQQIGLKI
jgi:hypothetical protein